MVAAPADGFLSRLDARAVGETAVRLGAGRETMEQKLHYGAGLILDKKVGDRVKQGESVARLFADEPARLEQGLAHFATAIHISKAAPKPKPVVLKTLT